MYLCKIFQKPDFDMKTVQLLDKKFVLSISEKEIRNAINAIAKQINTDLKNKPH